MVSQPPINLTESYVARTNKVVNDVTRKRGSLLNIVRISNYRDAGKDSRVNSPTNSVSTAGLECPVGDDELVQFEAILNLSGTPDDLIGIRVNAPPGTTGGFQIIGGDVGGTVAFKASSQFNTDLGAFAGGQDDDDNTIRVTGIITAGASGLFSVDISDAGDPDTSSAMEFRAGNLNPSPPGSIGDEIAEGGSYDLLELQKLPSAGLWLFGFQFEYWTYDTGVLNDLAYHAGVNNGGGSPGLFIQVTYYDYGGGGTVGILGNWWALRLGDAPVGYNPDIGNGNRFWIEDRMDGIAGFAEMRGQVASGILIVSGAAVDPSS